MSLLDPFDLILMVKQFPGRLLFGPVWWSLIFKSGPNRPKITKNGPNWVQNRRLELKIGPEACQDHSTPERFGPVPRATQKIKKKSGRATSGDLVSVH